MKNPKPKNKTAMASVNIDDILASVTPAVVLPVETQDLQSLTRAWVAERVAPELLPYPGPLVERMMRRIQKQVGSIQHTLQYSELEVELEAFLGFGVKSLNSEDRGE